MTPDAKVRFYKAMYRAKCEQYDALMREVDQLLEPQAVYTDGRPAPDRCECGKYSRVDIGQSGAATISGVTHVLGQPCFHAFPI